MSNPNDPLMGWGPALVGAGLGGALGAYYGEDAPSTILGALGGAGTALVGEHEVLPWLAKANAWADGYLEMLKRATAMAQPPSAGIDPAKAPDSVVNAGTQSRMPLPSVIPPPTASPVASVGKAPTMDLKGAGAFVAQTPAGASPSMKGMSSGATQTAGAKPNAVKPSNNISSNSNVYRTT